MKYKKTPLEQELLKIAEEQGDAAMVRARTAYFLETIRTKGFQLVTEILRNLEEQTMRLVRANPDPMLMRGLTGNLATIDAIRNSLTALLPAPERKNVDWLDENEEDYHLYEQVQVPPDGSEGPVVPGAGSIPGRES